MRRVDRPLVLAHRGFHRRAKQNTRRAIVAAYDAGADGIEFDVRVTADGVPVLFHNRARLVRGRRRAIAKTLRRNLPGWIPNLDEILRRAAAWRGFLIDVEIKDPSLHPSLPSLLRTVPPERLVVSSFHLPVCKALAERMPGYDVGWLRERPQLSDAAQAKRNGCRILVVHRRGLRKEIAKTAKARGLQLWAWGINTVRRARQAIELGVDVLITDRPDLLRATALEVRVPSRTSRRKDRPGS